MVFDPPFLAAAFFEAAFFGLLPFFAVAFFAAAFFTGAAVFFEAAGAAVFFSAGCLLFRGSFPGSGLLHRLCALLLVLRRVMFGRLSVTAASM